jgi:hypothetical protein
MTKIQCAHEDNIEYGELDQIDGLPQYSVTCTDCGATGTIMLEEGENIWDEVKFVEADVVV